MRKFFSQNYLGQEISRRSASLFLAATLALIAGCGSGSAVSTGSGTGSGSTGGTTTGGTTSVAQTITGTAATGTPLAGAAVTVQDSAGKTAKATTAADGTFSIAVTGMTPPFMLVAIPVSGSNLYSVLPAMDMAVTNSQNVNVTPITTLVMYELNAGADPATMYTGRTFVTLTAGAVQAKETVVRGKLPANAVNPVFSMMYGKFIAQAGGNDPYDTALDKLGKITTISVAGVTLTPATGAATTYTSSGGSSSAAGPALSLKLTDPATGAAVTSISGTSPATLTATLTNGSGAGVPNAIVNFSTDPLFGAFSGGANTALTNASGVATVTLSTPSTSGGAATVTASSTVAGTTVTASLSYSIGTSNITLSSVTVPAGVLSAYGTASVSVNVLNNGVLYATPITVKFTSSCAASGKATLTPSVTTLNGTASASYLDNGCNNPNPGDTITATLLSGVTATGNLKVNTPNAGSIQFVSVVTNPANTPPMITLKGTGGTDRTETARVTFRVVDGAGNPLGGTKVTFDLNTRVGCLALSSDVVTLPAAQPCPGFTLGSASSDPTTGNVVVDVYSGNVSTAVRVTASTGSISTQSDKLLVSTGIPAQDSFSLGASAHNIEGWSNNGEKTTLTIRAADHFHNPVPDGTAVSFTSEGGVVLPGCNTVGGVCTTELTSQALRPTNGRVTVLARAIGEETFTDLNGNGTVDNIGEMIDANGASTDMGEAFVDYNENGIRDANEPFFDFNGNGIYDGPNGKYEGLLCTGGAAICNTQLLPSGLPQRSMDVRAGQVIVFSTSNANITINGGNPIALPSCTTGKNGGAGGAVQFTVTVVDQNGNAMPAGTLVTFSSTNGTVTSPAYTVPDTSGCRIGNDPSGTAYACPDNTKLTPPQGPGSASFGNISVSMRSDAVFALVVDAATALPVDGTCTDATGKSGNLTVTVTTPKGIASTNSVTVTD
ncbi:MAG: hypothetical protein HY848_22240 [Betaproteobacteria bacterium]|nr:hypothetical protein [Betaproteobacteria bacterium]